MKKSESKTSKKEIKPKKRGREPLYTEELAQKVLRAIATNYASLNKICKKYSLPNPDTIYNWVHDYPIFSERYLIAKQKQQLLAGDKCMKVVESKKIDAPNKTVMVKTIQWQAARLNPIWQDKKQSEVTVKPHEDWLSTLK